MGRRDYRTGLDAVLPSSRLPPQIAKAAAPVAAFNQSSGGASTRFSPARIEHGSLSTGTARKKRQGDLGKGAGFLRMKMASANICPL